MRKLPIFTLVVAAAVGLTSVGRGAIHNAFFSGEQLSRNIAQPIVYSAILIVIALGLLEWLIRRWLSNRRDA
jgi:hypothetical protein